MYPLPARPDTPVRRVAGDASAAPARRIAPCVCADRGGKNIADERPALTKLTDLAYKPLMVAQDDSDVLFIALPHGESQKIVPQFAGKKKIIDLGGDFRLRDSGLSGEYYHADHTAPELLANANLRDAGTQRGHNPDRLVSNT